MPVGIAVGIALHEPTRELTRGTARIRLQEQPFQILQLLLDRPGAVITRDELRDRLWPDGTFVDFEHSLKCGVGTGGSPPRSRFAEMKSRSGVPVELKFSGRDLITATGVPAV